MFRGDEAVPAAGAPELVQGKGLGSWLSGATSDYSREMGRDLLNRWQDHFEWSNSRCDEECETYCKSTDTETLPALTAFDRTGHVFTS